jgi:hypothetical protein
MAFPSDLEIEVAFNNDIDETNYGQSGWTSILPFVSAFDGDLRGRTYERDQTEAGTLSVTLDNSDGRFLPGSVQSPYFPYVKSDRRFRIRGKNMVHPNVARGGSRDHNSNGFISYGLSGYSGNVYSFDTVRVITASGENPAGGEGKEKANDSLVRTKWLTFANSGWLQYQFAIGVRMSNYTVTSANDLSARDPKDWTLCGSNDGTTFTAIHTVSGEVFTDRYETHTYTITSPNYYKYYKLNITATAGATGVLQLAEWDLSYDSSDDLLLPDSDLTHYLEILIPSGRAANVETATFAWFVPLEYGVRLAHSAYSWRISGTEPAGWVSRLRIHYLDKDFINVSTQDVSWAWVGPGTPTVPTQGGMAHSPPANAKYAVMHHSYFMTTTNATDIVIGITGVQSELPVNLAPDISGFRDQYSWQIEGDGDGDYGHSGDVSTGYTYFTWGANDVSAFTVIPHLIPGEAYTATMEAKIVNSQPSVQFTGNEGQTGPVISSTSFTKFTCSFIAQQPEQELRWILQGVPTPAVQGLQIRLLNVQYGDNLTLSLPVDGVDAGITTWVRPKDIFEGWIESWPAVAGNPEMTITAVDRMKRLGSVELSNTLRESLFIDDPVLLMPLTDSMLDTPGRFSQLGSWSAEEGGPTYVDIGKSRGDLGIATYTTSTDDGPTGEASWKGTPVGTALTAKGYFFVIPYSKDYIAPTPPPTTPKPPPKPKPPSTPTQKSTYTKKWYATWSRSYEGDNSTRFDDSPYMYQGSYDSSSPGNQKSLAGFDWQNIAATLKGADILECYITIKNNHARWNKGLYAQVGTHDYVSKPSTWSSGTVSERRYGKKWVTEGGTLTINTGVSLGKEFLNGSTRGIAIGPEATNDHDNYGFFYGATHSARPYITIKYRK